MKRTATIVMMVFFFISMAGGAYALDFGFIWDYGNPPIWKIFKSGKAVQWLDWKSNRRFAIYDPGTPNDSSDDMVLDKETGLVWERSPSTDTFLWFSFSLADTAAFQCIGLTTGGRKGWRLATLQELLSLMDPSVSPGPILPAGHPFINVQSDFYWSATTSTVYPNEAWEVRFSDGAEGTRAKSNSRFVWCVRGGQGADSQ